MITGSPIRVLQFGTGVLLRGLCDEIIGRALADRAHPWDGSVAVVQSTGSGRADALSASGGTYTAFTRGIRGGESVQSQHSIRCIARAFAAERDWNDVIDLARSRDLRVIISNTTEAGLRASPTDSLSDAVPQSYPAKLLRVLSARFEAEAAPPVVVPCELIEHNGDTLHREVLALADQFDVSPSLRSWIADDVVFADTLVDRICTRPPESDAAAMDVAIEPFAQWAIEAPSERRDDLSFASGIDGAELVDDVSPYFVRKVRVLNGAHTAVVNLGLLAGHTTMRELCDDDLFVQFLHTTLDREILPPLVASDVPGVEQFAQDVLDRFANPYTAHKLSDIANGTRDKVGIRLVPTANDHVARSGSPPPLIALGVAAWCLREHSEPDPIWPDEFNAEISRAMEAIDQFGVRRAITTAIGT